MEPINDNTLIFASSLTVGSLKEMLNLLRMEDDEVLPDIPFTEEMIDRLGSRIDDAIFATVQDFIDNLDF